MNYLAIDTSNKTLSIVLFFGEKYYKFYDEECGVHHSECLMPKVEELLNQSGAKLSELDFFGCVVGAGSFTGIRIGVSTVKALCYANNKPFVWVTSFDTIAYNKEQGKNLAVIDAGHGGYYVAGYSGKDIIFEPSYIMKDQLDILAEEYHLLAFSKINDLDCEVVSPINGLILAMDYCQSRLSFDYEKLTPLYIRKSQAEEGRL